jgi:hypothetical protein
LESAPRATSRISTGFATILERTDVEICVGVGVAAAGIGATVILHWSDAREEGDLCSKALTRGKVGELRKSPTELVVCPGTKVRVDFIIMSTDGFHFVCGELMTCRISQ